MTSADGPTEQTPNDAPPSAPVDHRPSDSQWDGLTTVAAKRPAYEQDLYFREAWADVVDILGAGAVSTLHRVAMVTAKPDAVAGRRLRPMLDYMTWNGFIPLATERFAYTRHSMREIWRYDWNVYPVDRLHFSTVWYTSTDVPLFLLLDATEGPVPASVRLGELKGLADPALRTEHQMRSVLRPPNRVLNFVHVVDDPADLVRELGIMIDRPLRRSMLRSILRPPSGGDPTAAALDVITQLETEVPAHDLDVNGVLDRLARHSPEVAEPLRAMVAAGRKTLWDDLCARLASGAETIDRWDLIVLAASVLVAERPVPGPMLPPVRSADWIRRASSAPSRT